MKNTFFYFFFLILTGCASDKRESSVTTPMEKISSLFKRDSISLNSSEYIEWVENKNNGLRVEKTIDDYNFILQYRPLYYVTLMELRGEKPSQKSFKEKEKEFSGMYYFSLRIKSNVSNNILKSKISGEGEASERLQYFSFHMQNDVSLIAGRDTIPCSLFHYERIYSIASYSDFILGFEIPSDKENHIGDFTLIYSDQVLDLGTVKMKIKEEDLDNIPTLTL